MKHIKTYQLFESFSDEVCNDISDILIVLLCVVVILKKEELKLLFPYLSKVI
jgi:hypothetical protein